jgi:DNA-binding MarR family transcriptional regulator
MAVVHPWEPERWPTCRLLGIAARLDERRINRRLTGLGLTKGSLEALESIAELQPAKVSDIAALLCVTPQSLGKVLQRLQSLDLLTKKRGNDGRSTNIELTPRGPRVLAAADDLVRGLVQPATDADARFRSLLAQRIADLTALETPQAGRSLPLTGK